LALIDYNIRVASQPGCSKPVKWVYANAVKTHIEVYYRSEYGEIYKRVSFMAPRLGYAYLEDSWRIPKTTPCNM